MSSSKYFNELCLMFILILVVYIATLSPSIAGGDAGELVAEGCILGIAHPPGYPIFTMMVNMLSKLASGNIEVAYIINVSSAILTSAAAYFLGSTVLFALEWNVYDSNKDNTADALSHGGHIFGMSLFAFSPLIWQYATTAEVFPLNTFFASLIIYLVVLFAKTKSSNIAILGAFICGLAACNQHTIFLYEIPLIAWMTFLLRRRLLSSKRWTLSVYIGIAFLIGLSCYAYMPIAQRYKPEWGSWGDVTTFDGFIHHFLRRDYGTLQLFSGGSGKNAEGFMARNAAYISDAMFVQGLYCTPILAVLGALAWMNKGNGSGGSSTDNSGDNNNELNAEEDDLVSTMECSYTPLALVVTQIFYFSIFHTLANLPLHDRLLYGIHQRFWMQPNVLLFLLGGVGFDAIMRYFLTSSPLPLFSSSRGNSKKQKMILLQKKQQKMKNSKNKNKNTDKSDVNVNIKNENKDGDNKSTNNDSSGSNSSRWMIGYAVAGLAMSAQLTKWIKISDQRSNNHIRDLAEALLSSLPPKSLYLINYDHHWTSVRYLQKCQDFRSDVTTINLSMMTYKWFAHKHDVYAHLSFPGGFLTNYNTVAANDGSGQAFSISSFIEENIALGHPIHLSGRVTTPDPRLDAEYSIVPTGMTSRILPISQSPNATIYAKMCQQYWRQVMPLITPFPDPIKYPEETWEWTILRDFKDRLADTGAYLLQSAVEQLTSDPLPLIDAIYWLESAVILETRTLKKGDKVPYPLLKNAGLAHVHLIQSKLLRKILDDRGDRALPLPNDILSTATMIEWPGYLKDGSWAGAPLSPQELENPTYIASVYRDWSTSRFVKLWGRFIEDEDAKNDPQFPTIKTMYETATKIQQPPK